ncbi:MULTISPECIES: hypothetical protein [Pseudoalteromonas]|uniref:hypothetical protein n=1 Tax=Pseudoalteromonas TaxID=53246 RepID=UPI0012373B16|nr:MULTISPECIES: hypothetical protein [Pseudoalteromonas]MDK9682580.1 hypothetical protein [Pseudoalteromonas shioyasakiensis]
MRINFPKVSPNMRTLFSLSVLLILAALFYYVGQFNVINSLLLSLCCVLLVACFLVLSRWKAYINFLKQVGEKIERDRFYKNEHTVSAVPFKSLPIAVHACVDDSALLIKKANSYIAVNFENIHSFEPTEYCGHPIAKVVLVEQKDLEFPLYVPWNEEMAQHATSD